MLSYFTSCQTQDEITEQQRVSTKMQRINSATQNEIHRKPNPQQGIVYPEEGFFDFHVQRGNVSLKLHTYRYQPKEGTLPKALVFLYHGMLSHSNMGAHIAKYFADIGCIVVAFDHRGHGKSEGLPGYVESMEAHLSDTNDFINKMVKHHDQDRKLPIFLSGLSMGGLTSFRIAVEHPNRFRGVILFAPAIKTFSSGILLKKILGAISYIMPERPVLPRQLGVNTRNPLVQEDYIADSLIYSGNQRLGTIKSILGAMYEGPGLMAQFTAPWILIQGGLDKLVDVIHRKYHQPDVRLDLEKLSLSTDKTVLFYEDCWHDVWHEEEILDAMPKVVQWVKDRL